MARPEGRTTKSVYIEVSDGLWAAIKIHCFKTGETLKQFVTKAINKEMKCKEK